MLFGYLAVILFSITIIYSTVYFLFQKERMLNRTLYLFFIVLFFIILFTLTAPISSYHNYDVLVIKRQELIILYDAFYGTEHEATYAAKIEHFNKNLIDLQKKQPTIFNRFFIDAKVLDIELI